MNEVLETARTEKIVKLMDVLGEAAADKKNSMEDRIKAGGLLRLISRDIAIEQYAEKGQVESSGHVNKLLKQIDKLTDNEE